MIHPHTKLAYINDDVSYGVIATSLIRKGTIIWALDELDREFEPDQVKQMDTIYKDILEKYSFTNNMGNYVLCWDNARFVNHSFRSNCLSTAYDFEIAIRDILPGEELTDDYGYLNISKPFKALEEGTERKVVYPDDLVKFAKKWDAQLLLAFKEIVHVEQLLKPLLSEAQWQNIIEISCGKKAMDSIINCYYEPNNIAVLK